jgi:hypothetical protein
MHSLDSSWANAIGILLAWLGEQVLPLALIVGKNSVDKILKPQIPYFDCSAKLTSK